MPTNNQFLDVSLSATGSSVFAVDGCDVVSLAQSDGSEQWRSRVPGTPQDCSFWHVFSFIADVATATRDGVVYFNMSFLGAAAFDASTGAVVWRRNLGANIITSTVTEQWVVLETQQDGIYVLDRFTGAVAGHVGADLVSVGSGSTVVGDLVLFNTQDGRIEALDLTTMQSVWTSSVLSPQPLVSRPTVSGGRIYTYSYDFNTNTSQIVGVGP
jgi:outer membrane protein assembly factor BamB